MPPHFLRHSIHRRMGCCAPLPMLCAGLESEGAGSIACRLFLLDPADAEPTSNSLFVPGREHHVATDDPMMASMAGRYAAALFELAKDQRQLARSSAILPRFRRMLDDSAGPAPPGAQPRDLRRRPGQGAGRDPREGRHLRAHRQLPQADRQQPAPVRRRRHDRSAFARCSRASAARSAPTSPRRTPLTPEQMQQLSDTLRTSIGKNVQIDTRVDPACSAA